MHFRLGWGTVQTLTHKVFPVIRPSLPWCSNYLFEGRGSVQRWKHLVVQFLILYLSCNLSSHSGPNEHTSGTQSECWSHFLSMRLSFFTPLDLFGCHYFKLLSLCQDLNHTKWGTISYFAQRNSADPDTLEMRIVLRMSVCTGFKSKSFFNLSNKQAEFQLPCIHRLLKSSSRIETVCPKIHLKSSQ